MKVSEQIAIMKAFEDGKTIEVKRYDKTKWKILEYVEDYPFDFVLNEYRIKQVKKYRPYESVKEAFQAAKEHGFWVKCKKNKESLCTIHDFGCGICGNVYLNGYDALKFLNYFVWHDDGSPCGVKIN